MKKFSLIVTIIALGFLLCSCGTTVKIETDDLGTVKGDPDVEFIAPTGYEDYWVVCDTSESTELAYFAYYGIYDKTAKKYVVECTLTEEPTFSDGLARIFQDGYYGYINGKGEMIISPQFTDCGDFQSGRAAVCMNKWGVIDTDGNFIVSPQWEEVKILEPLEELTGYYSWQPVKKGMIWVSDGEYSGLFDFDGAQIIKTEYEISDFAFTEIGIYAPYRFYLEYPPACPTGDWYILFDYNGNSLMDSLGESTKARYTSLPVQGVHAVCKTEKNTKEDIYTLYDKDYNYINGAFTGCYTYFSGFNAYNRAVVIPASEWARDWTHIDGYLIEDGLFIIDIDGNIIAELPPIPKWNTGYAHSEYEYTYDANEYYVTASNDHGDLSYLIGLKTMEYTPWDMARMFGSAVVTIEEDTGLYFLFDAGVEIASNCTDIKYGYQINDEGNKIKYGFSCYHGNNCTEYSTDWQPYIPEA